MKKRSIIGIILFLLVIGGIGFIALTCVALIAMPDRDAFSSATPVVIVSIEGGIFESYKAIKEIEKYQKDDAVRVLVLRVNSPGGAIAPSQEIYRQIVKFRQSGKKVIASMGTIAASGGYYIACAADKIVASPGTVTGSIGVIMQSFGVQDLTNSLKIEPRVIKSGKLKDAGSPFRSMTDDEKAYFQNLADDMYSQFVTDIAEQRKMPVSKVRELAEGRVYSGLMAKKVGLVDELGNFFDAIELAKKEAGLSSDAEVKWPHKPSPFEEFFSEGYAGRSLQNFFLNLGARYMPLWLSPVSDEASFQ